MPSCLHLVEGFNTVRYTVVSAMGGIGASGWYFAHQSSTTRDCPGQDSPDDTMNTYDDIEEGRRLDLTVEFVSRRAVGCDGRRVYRLLVADRLGTRFDVLVAPDGDLPVGLKTGDRYRIEGMLGVAPRERTEGGAEGDECGDSNATVDRSLSEAASRLRLTGPVGVVDASTTVGRAQPDAWLADR